MLSLKNYNVLRVSLCLAIAVTLAESAPGTCSNPAPGIRQMVAGVDITKLDLNNLESSSGGIMSPVISFTCSGLTWKSPLGVEYQLPDQVWQLTPYPGGHLSANAKTYKTYEEVRKSMAAGVGLEGGFMGFSFAASASYSTLQEAITQNSKYISDVSAFVSATRVDMIPSWVLGLDEIAQAYVDKSLKGTFDSNPREYNKFIENFGTHYFARGYLGGYLRVVYETSSSYYSSKTDEQVSVNAKASFMKIISVGASFSSGNTKVDSKFTESSSENINHYGGELNLLSKDGVSKWQPTVAVNPWLFSGKLRPISDLIVDETKKSSLEIAVFNYVMRIYLNELQRLINTIKRKTSDPAIITLQSELNSMKAKSVLIKSEVENLKKKIEEFTVPKWLRADTLMC